MARAGRPDCPENERRSKRIYVYLSPPEYDVLKARSVAFGVSVSELARRAVTGVRIAAPVSEANVKRWREVGRVGLNLNQSARALNAIAKRLAQLDEPELSGHTEVKPVKLDEVVELARENARIVAEVLEVVVDIRAILMDKWTGNVEEAMQRVEVAEREDDGT